MASCLPSVLLIMYKQALLEEENKTVIAPDTPDANNHPPSKRLKKGEAHKRIYNDEVAFELALDEKYVIFIVVDAKSLFH